MSAGRHLVLWRGLDSWRAEAASLELTSHGVRAHGTQLGIEPRPYRLRYRLDAGDGWVTRALEVEASGEDWSREMKLSRDDDGTWQVSGSEDQALHGALDCDLAFSPLTNLMPIRRHGLHQDPGERDFLMAWVTVPDLEVHASPQRYEHVRPGVVRFTDLGMHAGFTAELVLDADGIVLEYPGLARRVQPG
jgi:uncharacterized protein